MSTTYLIKALIYGCDIIKAIIFFLIFLVGLASAYATEKQTALNGTTLNATKLNATVLNETALNETTPKELTIIPVSSQLKNPFKARTELSKFGRKQVYNL